MSNANRSVNEGSFAVTSFEDAQLSDEQARRLRQQKQKQNQQAAEDRARVRAGNGRWHTMVTPDLNPKNDPGPRMGIPEDQDGDGKIDTEFQGGNWRGNGPQGSGRPDASSRSIPGEDAGPGDTDGDNVVDNRKRFFGAQRKAVKKAFGSWAERRNPNGNFTAAKGAPVASDGDPLPGESEVSKPSAEPTANADQRDAAKNTAGKAKTTAKSSLSSVVSTATQNPMLVGVGALALIALFLI